MLKETEQFLLLISMSVWDSHFKYGFIPFEWDDGFSNYFGSDQGLAPVKLRK